MEEITAAALLAKQREVQERESEQQRAFNSINDAKRELKRAEEEYSEARWMAEESRKELRAMESAIMPSIPA